ncbi:RBP2-like protein [Mya arenaria]|uniref:RBP2-like protein n=1 Tax=Mya arenaria TaxID=6604 RepID=A0ABY7FJN4_MYAAR|nr:RBP2-like protein [Mya arenaria]
MFKSKRDVDRHVSYILNRIRNEKERNARGYGIAKLYVDIGEFEWGKRYLDSYMSVRETLPDAHKLMGQIHEGLRDKKKAIESYKRCLDLDPEQKEVILKVCELYGDAAIDISPDGAKIWIERAEKYFPNDAVVFKLKEKLVENGASESLEDMEQLISAEMVKNPEDVKLHVKLVRLWIRGQDVERAFAHVVDVEKTLAFVSSLPWYECVLDVFQVYADQQEGVENNGQVSWKESSSYSLICFLLCAAQPTFNLKSSWYCQLKQERKKKFYEHIQMTGCYRLSQAGHMIQSIQSSRSTDQSKLHTTVCTPEGRTALYSLVFTNGGKRKEHSFFLNSDAVTSVGLEAPSAGQRLGYDAFAFNLHGNDLEKLGSAFGKVSRGLETLRLVTPNSLALSLVVHVANTLDARKWRVMEGKILNIAIRTPKEVYFPVDLVVDPAVAKEMREQIYRRLAEDQDTNCNSSGSNRGRDQMVLLTKSKTALYQALDRLNSENNKELQDSVKRELDDVVCRLISLETGEDASESFLASVSRQQDSDTQETDEEEDSEPLKHATPRTPSRPHLKALESTNSALTGRLATLEETVKSNNVLIQEILVQLRQARDDNRTLRDQLQIISLQGLTTMPVMRPPSTPQQPRMSLLNMAYGSPAPMPGGLYDFQGQNGLPPHMAQYTMANAQSPRPGSAYGQPPDFYGNIDGEYHDPESEDFFIQDQNLVQEWPFGHKAGVEGKSTITYSPQPQQPVRAMNPAANAGMFAANALRGQAIQYGASYPSLVQPTQPPAAQMPGPGFFSQNSPMQQMSGHSAQGGVIPGTFGMAVRPSITPTGSPATLPVKTTPSMIASTKPVTPMMPPNAVIPSQAQEAKPKLIPGSVGVPVASTKAQSPRVTPAAKPSPVFGSPATTSALSGSAAAALSNLATKHQEETTKSTSQPPSVPVTTPEKTVFKGFTFTSTPKIAEIKEDTKPKEAHAPAVSTSTAAPKPFSGFGGFAFNTPTAKPPTVQVVKTEAQPSFPAQSQGQMPAFGLSPGQASASFGSLATQCQVAASFQAGGDQAGFVGTGTPLFGKSPTPRRRNPSICSDDHVDEYEPNVDFKPVIQLPELVEVKTGEENEERMFCERAKLYRYDKEVNQWKERGIGDIKILKHNETGSVRILMRREQVLKLCANHKINSEMKLSQMASSDKAWVWNAMDYAEGSMKNEKFAVKFKSSDIADKFKTAFEKCRDEMKVKEESKDFQDTNEVKPKETDQAGDTTKTEKSGDWASLFKRKEGSWTCDGCYITSDAHILKCPCCQSLKPGVNPEDIKSDTGSSSIFDAGSSQGTSGFKFGTDSSTASKPTGSGFHFGEGTAGTAKPASGFTFGAPTTTAASSVASLSSGGDSSTASKPSGSGFQFGGASTDSAKSASGFTFGTPTTVPTGSGFVSGSSTATTKAATTTTTTTSKTGFTFGSSGSSSGFEFGSTAVSVSTSSASSSTSELKAVVSTVESTKDSSGTSIFGTKTSTTTAGIFGGAASSSIFGAKTTSEIRGVFGSSSVFTQSTGDGKQGLVFGGGASKAVETLKSTTEGGPKSAGFDTKTEMKDKVNNGESLLAKFLSSPDSWKCETCLISNDGEASKCVACGTEKSESTGSVLQEMGTTGAGKSAFSVGSVFGQAETQPSAFNFGQAANTDKKSDEGFKFTIAPGSDTHSSQPAASLGSGFNFSMSMTPLKKDSPTKMSGLKSSGITSQKSSENNEEDYYVNKESDDCHIHFEPVIALPDTVEVKTGEEDEEVIFKHRAKLFRFLKGEWKERGLGDVKILYQPNVNKARILMRREQILKICCNHYVTPDLKLQPMPNSKGAALIWSAVDFADGEGTYEKFSIKFKNQEIAKQFEKAIEDAKGKLTGAKPKVQQPVVSPKVESLGALDDNGGDVEITQVEKATPEEIEKARKLMLPDHFYILKLNNKQNVHFCEKAWLISDPDKPFHWQGAGKQLFGSSAGGGHSDEEGEVQQGEDPQFEPVVPLPDLVEVKTGEEDEVAVFSQRSKLFRFDKDANQWKEKGIGEMKILKHKSTGKYRLLLRREQVYKLACNHALTADMNFEPLKTSETSWIWHAQDYTESQPRLEQFALKFKPCMKTMKTPTGSLQVSFWNRSFVREPICLAMFLFVQNFAIVHEQPVVQNPGNPTNKCESYFKQLSHFPKCFSLLKHLTKNMILLLEKVEVIFFNSYYSKVVIKEGL